MWFSHLTYRGKSRKRALSHGNHYFHFWKITSTNQTNLTKIKNNNNKISVLEIKSIHPLQIVCGWVSSLEAKVRVAMTNALAQKKRLFSFPEDHVYSS